MPYTKEELSNVGFYNNFIDKLRSEYLSQLVNRALNFFRDENNVLYSFEDISTSLGIEDAVLNNNPQYSTLETELSRTTIEEQTGYTDFKELLETESCSIQSQPLNKTIKNRNSEKLIDRSITELIKVEIADPLPENLENGDAPARAYYSLSSQEYENLSMDMAEITRYTKDILSIIKYYREYDKPREEKEDE